MREVSGFILQEANVVTGDKSIALLPAEQCGYYLAVSRSCSAFADELERYRESLAPAFDHPATLVQRATYLVLQSELCDAVDDTEVDVLALRPFFLCL